MSSSSRKRKSFVAESRRQIEERTFSKFVSSVLGKDILGRHHSSLSFLQATKRVHHCNDDNLTAQRFKKFSLVYNECSIAAIGNWVWSNQNKKSSSIGEIESWMATRHIWPTSATIFRNCELCETFGHYEIECPLLEHHNEAAVFFAKEIVLQKSLIVQQLQATSGWIQSGHLRCSKAKENDKECYSHNCVVCLRPANFKPTRNCAHCRAMTHVQCVLPPLSASRSGQPWYCSQCSLCSGKTHPFYHDDDELQIESCLGCVIEQRPRPPSAITNTDFSVERGWQSVVGIQANMSDSVMGEHFDDDEHVEMTQLGEFCIKARQNEFVDKRYYFRRELAKATAKPGCIVAWYSPESQGERRRYPQLGVLVETPTEQGLVLVRPLASWEAVLLLSDELKKYNYIKQKEQESNGANWQLLTVQVFAPRWMSVSGIYMVKSAPLPAVIEAFRGLVLPTKLAESASILPLFSSQSRQFDDVGDAS